MKFYGGSVVKNLSAWIGIIVITGMSAAFLIHDNLQPKPSAAAVELISAEKPTERMSHVPVTAVEGSLILPAEDGIKPGMGEFEKTSDDNLEKRQPLFDILSQYRASRSNLPAICETDTDSDMEKQLFAYINKERIRLGLDPLFWNEDLAEAARKHSTNMACNDFFSHTNPEGETFNERIVNEGYEYLAAGENLYAGDDAFNTPKQAYYGWYYSTRHYKVMTYPDLTEAGIGYVYLEGSRYGGYFTADFGTPIE